MRRCSFILLSAPMVFEKAGPIAIDVMVEE
jgi:hypothetical protein